MIRKINIVLITTIVMFGIYSCDIKKSPTKSKSTGISVWENDDNFIGDSKIILNAKVQNKKYIIAGLNFVAVYDSNNSDKMNSGLAYSSKALDSRPVISDKYILYKGNENIQFYLNSPLYYSCSGNTSSYPFRWACKLNEYDSSYSDKVEIPVEYYTRPIGAFNNKDQLLTVLDDTCTNGNNYSFCLVNLNSSDEDDFWGNGYKLSLNPTMKKISINDDTYRFLSYVGSFYNKFYISFGSELFIVDSEGHMIQANNLQFRINDMFIYNNTLYAINAYEDILYYSINEGFDWQSTGIYLPSRFVKFFKIDDALCFYINSQIAKINIGTGEIIELDNTGLEGNEITSVNKYDNKIWITTLSGMFTKNYEDFFYYKDEN